MNLKDLSYFKHLAETLSFTTTAKHFYISQPSISMALKRLEEELDTVLIERKRIHKKLQLTETGEILLKHSTKIMKSIEHAVEEIHDVKHQIVYFGYLPTIGGHFMTHLMPHLDKFSPSMKLIEEESSDVMLDLVSKGDVPLAIIGSDQPIFDDDDLIQVPLKQEELALWVATDHPLAQHKRVSAKDIKDEVFISLEQGYTHQRIFESWTQQHHIEESQTLYTKEIPTALSIASSTKMVAFMSDTLVNDRSRLVRVPLVDGPQFYISLIVNKHYSQGKQFQLEFNELMIKLVQAYSKDQLPG